MQNDSEEVISGRMIFQGKFHNSCRTFLDFGLMWCFFVMFHKIVNQILLGLLSQVCYLAERNCDSVASLS